MHNLEYTTLQKAAIQGHARITNCEPVNAIYMLMDLLAEACLLRVCFHFAFLRFIEVRNSQLAYNRN